MPTLLPALLGLRPAKDGELVAGQGTRIATGHSSCFAIRTQSGRYILIDAGADTQAMQIEAFLLNRGASLSDVIAVFATHAHADHVAGLHRFLTLPEPPPVHVGAAEMQVLQGEVPSEGFIPRTVDRLSRKYQAAVPGLSPVQWTGGETVRIDDLAIMSVALPGHTKGSLGYLVRSGNDSQPCVFYVGDAMDITRSGMIRNAAAPLTADTRQSAQSIEEAAHYIDDHGFDIAAVVPAHSGAGDQAALRVFRA